MNADKYGGLAQRRLDAKKNGIGGIRNTLFFIKLCGFTRDLISKFQVGTHLKNSYFLPKMAFLVSK